MTRAKKGGGGRGEMEEGRWKMEDERGKRGERVYTRDSGREVAAPCGIRPLEPAPCSFLTRLCADSLPLASERFGEPGRLRLAAEDSLLRKGSACFSALPEGVLLPLDEAPEGSLSALALRSSSLVRSSSSRWRSSSESSESLCDDVLVRLLASSRARAYLPRRNKGGRCPTRTGNSFPF